MSKIAAVVLVLNPMGNNSRAALCLSYEPPNSRRRKESICSPVLVHPVHPVAEKWNRRESDVQFRRRKAPGRGRHVNWRSSGKGLPTARRVSTSKHGCSPVQGRAKCRRVERARRGRELITPREKFLGACRPTAANPEATHARPSAFP